LFHFFIEYDFIDRKDYVNTLKIVNGEVYNYNSKEFTVLITIYVYKIYREGYSWIIQK